MSTEMAPEVAAVLSGERRWHVAHSDALSFLRTLPDNSADSLVTDPPSGIAFMNRDWDKDKGGRDAWIAWLAEIMREAFRVLKPGAHGLVWALPRTSGWTSHALEDAGFEVRDCIHHVFGSGFPKSLNVSKAIDARDGLSDQREVVHSYTASGNAGTSTKDKGGTYGVGVANSDPVELSVTRGATEKSREWDGWGTALKPGHEHWWLVRKPLDGTIVDNVLKYGTGALNIDGCRVATDWNEPDRPESWKQSGHSAQPDAEKIAAPPGVGIQCHPGGRWPPNMVFTHSAGCRRAGERTIHGHSPGNRSREADRVWSDDGGWSERVISSHVDADGLETIAAYDCAPDCPVAELARQSGELASGFMAAGTRRSTEGGYSGRMPESVSRDTFGDTGTAARFFPQFEQNPDLDDLTRFIYQAKPSRAERDAGLQRFRKRAAGEATNREEDTDGLRSPRAGAGRGGGSRNGHPTVKSTSAMRWFCRLVTPINGIVVDPFSGSGSTGVGAHLEGFRFLGCEMNDTDDEPFVSIARARISHVMGLEYVPRESLRAKEPPKQRSLFETEVA